MEKMVKILIVDDDEKMAATLKRWLEAKGHEVVLAHNGQDALVSAKQEKPDLMLLDIRMPGMDGHEVLKCLRADAACATLKVIMLTAQTDVSDVAKSMIAGKALDYAVKDLQGTMGMDALYKKIEKALG
jgi:DNA-binding response OmpR family regulator